MCRLDVLIEAYSVACPRSAWGGLGMRRRDVLALLGGAATGWPLAMHAQQKRSFLESAPDDRLGA